MKRILIQSMLIVSFLSIIASCQQQKGNYESDGPFIVVTDYIGEEIHVLDSFPSIYAIELSGKLRLYSEIEANHKLTIDDDAPTYEFDLSKEEIEYLKSLIKKNNFWKLDEHYLMMERWMVVLIMSPSILLMNPKQSVAIVLLILLFERLVVMFLIW